ncbi:MAG: HAMP domain-containing histidine kinase [Ignavibacteriae bacterium]|nr:HAMP domain-containing histidine kinase [Ignavibacteriota bacterium]
MLNTTKKISIIISVILLLPLVIYTFYELSNLSENEKFLENIYSEQLNTIIFSVNQNVDDVLQSWSGKINDINQSPDSEFVKNEMIEFIKLNSSVSLIVIADSLISNNMKFYSSGGHTSAQNAVLRIQKILKSNSEIIKSLIEYKILGYNKIQPLVNNLDETPLLSFLIRDEKRELRIVLFVINMDKFIKNILSKRINSISNNELIVSIFHNKNLISYTGGNEVTFSDLLEYKKLWAFPNYFLGISTPGKTIKDIVRERSTTNLIMLALLNIVILLGIIFLFINIRKEIKLSQLKSDFVSNVSHEIRTPLALIGMFAETLELHRVETEEQKDEYYKIIRKETERLTRIVNSILNFSKMDSRSKKYNFEKTNLNLILDEVLKTYQHELNNSKNECIINKAIHLPDLELDKEAVMEAVINLIDNALKYCESKCKLEISTGIDKNFAYLEVCDNGIGISKENQKKIFEKFYRVTSGNVHNTKGSGLGLSLVKNIMEAHNGNVIVESKLGEGSKFQLKFPLNKIN